MRKCLLLLVLVAGGIVAAPGQCVEKPGDPCVPINQSTLDKATAAATELLAARDVIVKYGVLVTATQAERESAARLIDRLNNVIAVQDRLVKDYENVIALYKQTLQMYAELVERQSKQLQAPKSGWRKLADALKTIATFAAGVALGRGF